MFQIKAIGSLLPDGVQVSTLEIQMDELFDHETGNGTRPVRHQMHWCSSALKQAASFVLMPAVKMDARRQHQHSVLFAWQQMPLRRSGQQPAD